MTEPENLPAETWTDALRDICREACAYPYGEPPCWQVAPEEGPCWSCYNQWTEGTTND